MENETWRMAQDFVNRWEGGLDDDPADSGGITKYGVSLAFLADLMGNAESRSFLQSVGIEKADRETIKGLTKEQAESVFFHVFWQRQKTYLLEPPVAVVFYDTAVNCGVSRAAKLLQATVGAAQDGIVGPNTRTAVTMYGAYRAAMNMLAKRDNFYRDLAERRPKDKRFLRGWLNRTADLRRLIDGVYGDDLR